MKDKSGMSGEVLAGLMNQAVDGTIRAVEEAGYDTNTENGHMALVLVLGNAFIVSALIAGLSPSSVLNKIGKTLAEGLERAKAAGAIQ